MVYQFTGKRPQTAIQWYNDEVSYFEEIDKEDVVGCDICSDGSHVGIVSKYGSTICANGEKIIENDWVLEIANMMLNFLLYIKLLKYDIFKPFVLIIYYLIY